MDDADTAIGQLQQRIEAYAPDRYPIQHAASRFHLGNLLAGQGRFEEAEEALRVAVELFEPTKLAVEHAKALNALGAVLRGKDELRAAAEVFSRAAEIFKENDLPLDQGAALHNLSLVLREQGESDAAAGAARQAVELLQKEEVPAQAAAALRELGSILLSIGDIKEALAALEDAETSSVRLGDLAGVGAAANLRGLALLASDRLPEAIAAFQRAVGAHPRSIRPEGYSMSKANLALAWERADDKPRARLAALQAISLENVPEPVRVQAQDVLERVGEAVGTLAEVILAESRDDWQPLVREELARWSDLSEPARVAECGAWLRAQAESAQGLDLAEALLGGLLELPPDDMNGLIDALVRAASELDHETYDKARRQIDRAMPRFHVPQWMRLKDTFNRAARSLGQTGSWG